MTREEHLDWCKRRALAYLPANPVEAITSMLSDLGKHDDTRHFVRGGFAELGLAALLDATPATARSFIEGFH